MPIDYKKYPPNWEEIREQILIRAGGLPENPVAGARCENCGIRNYELKYKIDGKIVRFTEHYERPFYNSFKEAQEGKQYAIDYCGIYSDPSVVVLTVAHIHDPDPMNCADNNLKLLCQACHNRHDRPMRNANAAKTRIRKKVENGQPLLIDILGD